MKKAFTLAEVLITLGIIGVVAAMTLPSLINRTQKKELQAAFLKTYSELNQASQLFYVKEGISVSDYGYNLRVTGVPKATTKLMELYMGYFKGVTNYNHSTYANTSDTTIKRKYKIKTINGKIETNGTKCDATGLYADIAGRVYSLNDLPLNMNENGPVICVDINGEKPPNKYGYDNFLFVFTTDGKVIPMGQDYPNNVDNIGGNDNNPNSPITSNGFVSGPEYCDYSSSSAYKSLSCAVYALMDQSPEENGSYWKDFLP